MEIKGSVTHQSVGDLKDMMGIDAVKRVEDTLVEELSKSINSDILKRVFELGQDHLKRVKEIIEKNAIKNRI